MVCSKGKIKAYIVMLNFTENVKAKFKSIFYCLSKYLVKIINLIIKDNIIDYCLKITFKNMV